MQLVVLGLNYKTAPVEIREKLSIAEQRGAELLQKLKENQVFEERLLLSTCNRTEFYGVALDEKKDIGHLKRILSEYSSLELQQFEDKLYLYRQPHSVRHLFSVASGLDSMVVGETEIIGQVKSAYFSAQEKGQTGKILNNLFQRSFKVAKDLRTQTDIGVGRVSVASIAAGLAQKIFDDLKNIRVMVLGTGDMSTQVAQAMVSKGAYPIVVSSRHFERAEALAKELGGEAMRFEHYENHIREVDVIIASTAAPTALIHAAQVRAWMKARHEKPIFMIDIAVPRNIDPEIEKLDNVYLYNIDDLTTVAEKNKQLREGQIERCLDLVNTQTQHYMKWLAKEFGPKFVHE